MRAVRRHDDPGLDQFPAGCVRRLPGAIAGAIADASPHGQSRPIRSELHLAHARRAVQHYPGLRGELLPERRADVPVRHHVAQRLEPLLGRADSRRAVVTGVRHADLAHRASVRVEVPPDTQRLEYPPAAVAECGGPVVEAGLPGRVGDDRLDERDALAGAAERQRQTGPDHAAADDCDIDDGGCPVAHAAAISFSMASGSVGAAAVSTSWPDAVTATSSSMRMPMFQKRLGTPLLPAGI